MGKYNFNNLLSSSPSNCNIGYNNSWVRVENSEREDLYAQASFITNFDDFTVTLSGVSVSLGALEIKDGDSNLKADVASANGYNALRVLSQDLDSSIDDISIGDRSGSYASINASTSSLNVNVTNHSIDSFGRLRISQPVTLFDSSHRYNDNGKWSSLSSVDALCQHNANQGLMDLTISSQANSFIVRETTKVFPYQPGKSLLILNSFVAAPSSTNLIQRVGYFGEKNGIYLQIEDDTVSFVKRTIVNGSTPTDTVISQQLWNQDKLDGTGPSSLVLDITKSQIMWIDIEWLGAGSVRTGFVIDGKFILCHQFNHANYIPSTYMTTGTLPIRYEIKNKGLTSGTSTLKQICSTVISEGGYELTGGSRCASTSITAPTTLTTAGIEYPVMSLRLKSDFKDAVTILSHLELLGNDNNVTYKWSLYGEAVTTGGLWSSSSSPETGVEYNLNPTAFNKQGILLKTGFFKASNQSTPTISFSKDSLIKMQFSRDYLNNINYEYVLTVSSSVDHSSVYAAMEWEDVVK